MPPLETILQPPARPNDPLRTYQFRVGLLPPPPADSEARPFFEGGSTQTGSAPAAPTGYIAGVKRVSGLSMTLAGHEIREGGNSLHRYANPDRATWDPITLEQGLATDTTLELWAFAAIEFLRSGTVSATAPVKRNVFLDVYDPALPNDGRVRRYLVFNAWVSRFQAIPQLDATADEVALLSVELTHEGWRLDAPPTFEAPARPGAARSENRGGQ